MSRAIGTIHVFGFGLVIASSVFYAACGGGSGDVSGPPDGAGAVDSLVLALDSADVIVGDTIRITAEARDADGQVVPGVQLSYASSNTAVATVSGDGLVTSVDLGVAEIEVAVSGAAIIRDASLARSYANVMSSQRSRFRMRGVPRVVITPGEQTLDPGLTSQYSASITNVRGQGFSGVRRSWSSSDPSVAGIDANGLVTTRQEGDTDIIMTVTADPGLEVTARVPLHVAVCDGIFRVPEWRATGDVEYKENGFVPGAQANYTVDQTSTGAGVIKQVQGSSNADSTVWEGAVTTGSIRINNLFTFLAPPPVNTGRTTESKSGEIPADATARLRLTVKRPADGGFVCTYNFEYVDDFTWEITNNHGAPSISKAGPVGIARLMDQAVGTRTPSGGWVLGSDQPGTGIQLPAKAFSTPQSDSDYTVGTTIAASMIVAFGGASATYGEATFVHMLTGRPR